MKIPLFKIYWDDYDVRLVTQVIKSGMNWAIGPNIDKFERIVAEYTGAKYALSFNSGTSALFSLMKAYDFRPQDEIIVPSFTFIATANAPVFVGAKPIFCEIEEETFGMDPEDIEKRITKNTKAIMPVHFGGYPCKIQEIKDIARKHRLILIEDAAESLGAAIRDKKVGTFGDAAMFSFCAPKVITTGEGGIIVTDNRNIYEKLKLIRSHGRLETENYFTATQYMDYITLGYNFRISNITAALGISQMNKLEKVIRLRRQNARYLTDRLRGIKEVELPLEHDPRYRHIYQMYTIRIKGGKKLRDALKSHLNNNGVMAKVYFDPVHLSCFYRDKFGYKRGDLPITESISDKSLTLPMHPSLSKKEMDFIVNCIKKFYRGLHGK